MPWQLGAGAIKMVGMQVPGRRSVLQRKNMTVHVLNAYA